MWLIVHRILTVVKPIHWYTHSIVKAGRTNDEVAKIRYLSTL